MRFIVCLTIKKRRNFKGEAFFVRADGCELRMTVDKGEGVFATRHFRVGETVMVGVIERRLAKNTAHASQVSRSEFVLLGGMGPKVNHSCDPNCGVRLNESGAYDLMARRIITPGDEITFDYAMRNYSIENFPSRCRCGSEICRGSVTGWKDLPDERKVAYRGLIAPYLLEIDR
ncbi:MAG: SET domain-containing protein-lysine N-methyltransferase [Actinomycetota bacterium]